EQRAMSHYLLPLMVKWTRYDRFDAGPNAIAAVRRGSREGSLIDAGSDPDFIKLVLGAMRGGNTVEHDGNRLEAVSTGAFASMPLPAVDTIAAPNREQSNTTVIVDAT